MSEGLGPISFPEEDRHSREVGRRPYSKRLSNVIDEEARGIIARAYKRTESLLIQHRDMLEKVSIIQVNEFLFKKLTYPFLM